MDTMLTVLHGLAVAIPDELNITYNNSPYYDSIRQLRPIGVEFFDYYNNITAMETILSETRRPSKQDLQCVAELAQVSQGINSGSIWALRMLDAWGSKPTGALYGNKYDFGNFDECININRDLSTGNLKGKYCFARLPIGQFLDPGSPILRTISMSTGICFPSSCSGTRMNTLLRQLFQQFLNISLDSSLELIDEESCQTSEREPLDGLTIFTIVLISVLAGVVCLATLYDYFWCPTQDSIPPIVKALSARASSRALFRVVDSKSNPNVIDCLHGIRSLSLIWVVFCHDYMMALTGPNINAVHIKKWSEAPFAMFIRHGFYSVDSFFFLSGLLVVMVALRAMEKQKGKLNVPLMYLHRYLRLTPVVAIAILIYMTILPHLGNGPLWTTQSFEIFRETCGKTWYLTLLYVQNYATRSMCLSHTWYLGADTQMYFLSPLLLIPLYKWGWKAASGVFILMLLLSICLFSMMVIKNYSMESLNINSQFKIYFSTHSHAAPWLIGILLGYFLHANRGKTFKLHQLTVWIGWTLSLSCFMASIFSLYATAPFEKPLPLLKEAFYLTLTRIAWPLALGWVVFACKNGYGGLANSFLSSPLWQPLSKLSYSAYIFHLLIQALNIQRVRTNTFFTDYDVFLRFWGDFGLTLTMSYFSYIFFEAPFGGLESLFLPNRSQKIKKPLQPQPFPEPQSEQSELPPKTDAEATS